MAHSAIQFKAHPKNNGAVISPFAGRYYDLPILAENIEGDEEIFATFFSIGKSPPKKKEKNLLLQEGNTPLYFMEVEGHLDDRIVHSLFESLSKKYLIKHLGSYPL